MAAKEASNLKPQNQQLSKRWGAVVNEGWTAIPNILIERQQALQLKPTEMNIILVLLKYWWEEGKSPYPSKQTIGELINRDATTVRKSLKRLEELGYVKRGSRYHEKGGQTSNEYDLSGLVDKLKEEAKEQVKLKETRKSEDARIRRGSK
jgi:predicted transcriptional regulator